MLIRKCDSIITSRDGNEFQCKLVLSHTGAHTDLAGTAWTDNKAVWKEVETLLPLEAYQ